MSYGVRNVGDGLAFTAPGPRLATRYLAPPPPSNVTPTAPGSNYMSYGPGLVDRSQDMYNAIPFAAFEGHAPESNWDVRGGGLVGGVVNGSPARGSTGVPFSRNRLRSTSAGLPGFACLLAVGALGWFAYKKVVEAGSF